MQRQTGIAGYLQAKNTVRLRGKSANKWANNKIKKVDIESNTICQETAAARWKDGKKRKRVAWQDII
ncbi:MAG: hypothetical protein IPJ90_15305 [Anaerolineaceae bacterium]|nr:hypothetical protein [Anaerolineaceae bacterium]